MLGIILLLQGVAKQEVRTCLSERRNLIRVRAAGMRR